MRLFYHDTSSYHDGAFFCYDNYQAFLTGPDSNPEYDEIMSQARSNSDVVGNMTSYNRAMILIGLKRTLQCTSDNGAQTPACQLPQGFIWQDGLGSTSNTLINQNFNSDAGVETSPSHVRACAGIQFITDSTSNSQNKVYSLDCNTALRSNGKQSRMVVCGKIGTCPSTPPTTISTSIGTTTSASSTSETSTVPSTSTRIPSTSTTELLTSTTTEKPSTSTSEFPTSSTTQEPSTSTSEAPSSSTTAEPSTSTSVPPSSSTTQVPSSSTTEAPTSTSTQAPSTSTTIQSTTTGGCISTVCGSGWFKTQRGGKTLCMRLFYHDTSSYDDGAFFCYDNYQAFLTGPDTNPEYDEIMSQARLNPDVVTNMTSYNRAMILIGLKRTPQCTSDNGAQTPACQLPQGFIWQDGLGSTSNTLINQNFNSDAGVETSPSLVRACAGIQFITDSTSNSQNKVYSLDCNTALRSNGKQSRMVVCGKIGTCPSTPPTTISTSIGTTTSASSTSETSSTSMAPSTSTASSTVSSTSTATVPSSTSTSSPTTTECPVKVCKFGFHPVLRNGKMWCMRPFFHFVQNFTEGSDYCQTNYHSVLTGPADETEYNWLLDQTKTDSAIVKSLANGNYVSVMMVLGAKRTQECLRDENCNPANAYYFTDGVTTSNYIFANKFKSTIPVQPVVDPDQPEECVGIRVWIDPSKRSDELLWSLSCDEAMSAYQVVLKLLVCGHPAVCVGSSSTTVTPTTTPSTTTVTTATPTVPTTTTVSTTTEKVCTKSQLKCAEGWTPFNRTTARPYCFKVINQYNQTYDQSVALCQSNGGYLSGIENITEYNFVVQLAKDSVNYTTSNNSQILVTIALKRKVICLTQTSTNNESCTSFKAYEFVDDDNTKYVSIIQHYNLWASGQPVLVSSQPHGCVGIMVTNNTSPENGKMYATQCETGVQNYGMSNAALCARVPDVCPP
ncbi:hypothetical protein L3Y34_008001 [Caenorhabditis briggsae]|nr:hypothetical protein L3Y34_008001 [Caenorhabditis briggsae]